MPVTSHRILGTMKVVARIAGVPRSTRRLVAAWLIVEVTIWAFAWAIGRAGLSFPQSPVDVLSTWDGTPYSAIARNGYSTEGAEVRRFAVFPAASGNLATVGRRRARRPGGDCVEPALHPGQHPADRETGRETNGSAQLSCEPGFWMLVTPVGFFSRSTTTESLFLLFSLLLVIAYRRNRIVVGVPGRRAGRSNPPDGCLPARALSPGSDQSLKRASLGWKRSPALLHPSQGLVFMWLMSAGVSVIPWPICIWRRFGGNTPGRFPSSRCSRTFACSR